MFWILAPFPPRPHPQHRHRHRDTNTNNTYPHIINNTQVDTAWLQGRHVVFGEVLEGKEVVDKMSAVERGRGDRPTVPVKVADCGVL